MGFLNTAAAKKKYEESNRNRKMDEIIIAIFPLVHEQTKEQSHIMVHIMAPSKVHVFV